MILNFEHWALDSYFNLLGFVPTIHQNKILKSQPYVWYALIQCCAFVCNVESMLMYDFGDLVCGGINPLTQEQCPDENFQLGILTL